jgi:hypothetical protein
VTISVRAVSVNTGKVLAVVTVQKTILSTADSATALKFFDAGTQAFEAEAGLTINEPGTYAVKAAIELAVVELIKEGQRKSIWDFKSNVPVAVAPPAPPAPPAPATAPAAPATPPVVQTPVISSEIKKPEEKKVEPVQTPTPATPAEVKVVKEEKLAVTDMQTGVKPTVTLFGERVLKENSYLYAKETETSTKVWWVSKGSIMSIKQPGTEGWWKVVVKDGTNRGGWIQSNKLEEKK